MNQNKSYRYIHLLIVPSLGTIMISREELITLYPESKDEINQISNKELNDINKFLRGEDIVIPRGSIIKVTPPHVLSTTNEPNHGIGTPVPESVCGYSPGSIPRFEQGVQYELSLEGKMIVLEVHGTTFAYLSTTSLRTAFALGILDQLIIP